MPLPLHWRLRPSHAEWMYLVFSNKHANSLTPGRVVLCAVRLPFLDTADASTTQPKHKKSSCWPRSFLVACSTRYVHSCPGLCSYSYSFTKHFANIACPPTDPLKRKGYVVFSWGPDQARTPDDLFWGTLTLLLPLKWVLMPVAMKPKLCWLSSALLDMVIKSFFFKLIHTFSFSEQHWCILVWTWPFFRACSSLIELAWLNASGITFRPLHTLNSIATTFSRMTALLWRLSSKGCLQPSNLQCSIYNQRQCMSWDLTWTTLKEVLCSHFCTTCLMQIFVTTLKWFVNIIRLLVQIKVWST